MDAVSLKRCSFPSVQAIEAAVIKVSGPPVARHPQHFFLRIYRRIAHNRNMPLELTSSWPVGLKWPSSAECISNCIDVLAAGVGLQQTHPL
jgi:hypothetical protein